MTSDPVLWMWLCTRCGNAGGSGSKPVIIQTVSDHLVREHASSGTSARALVGPVTMTADISAPAPVWSAVNRTIQSLYQYREGGEDDGRTEAPQGPEEAEAAPAGL